MLKKLYRKWLSGPIAKSTIKTTFVLGLRLVVQAGTLLCVARMLGPEQFGAFAGVASLAVLLGALSTFGTNWVLLGELSKITKSRDKLLSYILPTTLICGAFILTLYLFITFFLFANTKIGMSVLILIGLTEIILQPFFSLIVTEHHASEHIAKSQFINLLPLALRLVFAAFILLVQLNEPLHWYLLGYLFSSIIALLIGGKTLSEAWPRLKIWRLPTLNEVKSASGFAISNMTRMGPAELDKTLAAKLLPLGEVGIYAASSRSVSAIFLPISSMLLSVLPKLFRASDHKNTSFRNTLILIYLSALIYSVVVAFLLWIVAPFSLIIFGENYQGMGDIIRALSFAMPGIALRLIASNLLVTLNRPWFRVTMELLGMLLVSVLSVLLVKSIGVYGIIISIIVSESIMAIFGAWLIIYSIIIEGEKRCQV